MFCTRRLVESCTIGSCEGMSDPMFLIRFSTGGWTLFLKQRNIQTKRIQALRQAHTTSRRLPQKEIAILHYGQTC